MEMKMKHLKSILLVTVLSTSFAAPAFASEAPIAALPQFTAADTQLMFEQDARPMQLAALSLQEMKETEGAVWWFALYYYGPAITAAGSWMATSGWRTIPSVWHRVRQR